MTKNEVFWAIPVDAASEADSVRCVRAEDYERLRAALLDLYNGTAEYVYLNNLGDPHNTTPMRRASEVLGVAYPRSMRPAAEPSVDQKTCEHEWTDVARCLVCDLTYDMYDPDPSGDAMKSNLSQCNHWPDGMHRWGYMGCVCGQRREA